MSIKDFLTIPILKKKLINSSEKPKYYCPYKEISKNVLHSWLETMGTELIYQLRDIIIINYTSRYIQLYIYRNSKKVNQFEKKLLIIIHMVSTQTYTLLWKISISVEIPHNKMPCSAIMFNFKYVNLYDRK